MTDVLYVCECVDGANVHHLLQCPVLAAASAMHFPRDYDMWPIRGHMPQVLCLDGPSVPVVLVRAIWLDTAMHVSNVRRHQARPMPVQQLVVARIRANCRECPAVKTLMVEIRRGMHRE